MILPSNVPITPAFNNLMGLRVLRMLTTPYDKTDAYKLKIIDKKGNPLKKAYELDSQKERDAYTYLHRLVFRMKRLIDKLPAEKVKFQTYATAFALIKEHCESQTDPNVSEFEGRFIAEDVQYTTNEMEFVEQVISGKYIMPFKLFAEEGGMGVGTPAGAPANNIATTPGIAMPDPARFGTETGYGAKKLFRRKGKENETAKKSV